MSKLSSPIDLIKRSIEIFFKKENFIYFVQIYSIFLPFSIFSILQIKYVPNVWITIGVNLIYLSIYAFVTAAGIEAVSRVVHKNSLSIKETFSVGMQKYWKFGLLLTILFFVTGFGFVLFVIPGIIFLVWFSFSNFVFIEKQVGVKEAMLKSKELVKGKFWKILGRLFVFGVFSILVEMVFSLVPYGVGTILTTIFGALFVLPSYLLYQELA